MGLKLGNFRITIVSGRTGSGKTSWLVSNLLREFDAMGQKLDWDPARVPTLFTNIQLCLGPIEFKYPRASDFIRQFSHPFEEGGPLEGELKSNPISNAIVVVDESQKYFNSPKLSQGMVEWTGQKRHRQLELVFVTPNEMNLPKKLRDDCSWWVECVDLSQRADTFMGILPLPPVRRVYFRGFCRPGRTPDDQENYSVPKADLELYDTQGGTFGEETPSHLRDDITNSANRRWRSMGAFAAVITIIGMFFGFGLRFMFGKWGQKYEPAKASKSSKVEDRRPITKQPPVAIRGRDWRARGGEGDRQAWRAPDGSEWIELIPGSEYVTLWVPAAAPLSR